MGFTIWQAVVLAIVQGLTEWLPVSSSGHLAVADMILGSSSPLLFNLAVHIGTLAAVILVLRKDVADIVKALPRMLGYLIRLKRPPAHDKDARLAFYVASATIPAVLFGFFLKGLVEESYRSKIALAGFFLFTGFMLLSTRGLRPKNELNQKNSMLVGLAQILTIFPGVSRSGTTISMGLHAGMGRTEAARFSFLLSIPLILGAAIYEALSTSIPTDIFPHIAIGMVISFVVGAASIRFLMKLIAKGRLHFFAPYCILMGIALLIWSIL